MPVPAFVSLVSTWMGDRVEKIKCCCVSCRVNTVSNEWGIDVSLGADNAVPVLGMLDLPYAGHLAQLYS